MTTLAIEQVFRFSKQIVGPATFLGMPLSSGNWDFYFLRVDDEPASIFVDLAAEADAPMRSHPYMAFVRVYMKLPREDGLSSKEEFDELVKIENAMETNLCGADVRYVGRNTSGGCRDFFFYLSTDANWKRQVESALARFKDYEFEADTREDAEWSTYFDFLLPGPTDRQIIQNRKVCDALREHGDSLTASREIDHWCYFDSEQAASAFLADVTPLGFNRRKAPASIDGEQLVGVRVWRSDVPSQPNINEVTLLLLDAALRHGGEYDGWECPVVNE